MAWIPVVLLAILYHASPQGFTEGFSFDNGSPDLNRTDLISWNASHYATIFNEITSTISLVTQRPSRIIPDSYVKELSSLVMNLGVRMYKILRRQYPKKNFVFSPYCLATGLSVVYAGASGATKDQIGKVLRLGSFLTEDDLHHTFNHVHKILTSDIGNTTVNLANAVFSSEGLNFKHDFSDVVRNLYSGEIFSTDVNEGDKSLEYINEWISNRTDNLVQKALEPGSIQPPVLLLLLSVIHFQGSWTFPFQSKKTKLKRFYLAPNIGEDMYMMHKEKQKLYYGDAPFLKSKILELPFEGDALSFYIILPNDITGLPVVETFLSAELVWRDMSRMVWVDVELILPRFKLETRIQLGSSLGALGSELMLSPSLAELSGIADGANLFLSGMAQNSVFEVTERGVEAASIIGQQIALSAINSVYQVTVDHPFLFFILDKRTKVTLFMGRVVCPPEGSDSLGDLGPQHQMDISRASTSDPSHVCYIMVLIVSYALSEIKTPYYKCIEDSILK